MLRTWSSLSVALALGLPALAHPAPPHILPARDFRVELAPDVTVELGPTFLEVTSGSVKALAPAPYGSSRRGYAGWLDHASVTAKGNVTLSYASACHPKQLQSKTSLNELRAKLLVARAQAQPAPEAKRLLQQANALAPSEPTAAVMTAALHAGDAKRATAQLAPAFAQARFETYFQIVKRAPELRTLPLVAKQLAAKSGNVKLEGDEPVLATSGSLVALAVSAETEADCAQENELLLLDLTSGAVVFRWPFRPVDDACQPLAVTDTRELQQLLNDFGFQTTGEYGNRVELDLQRRTQRFDFARAQRTLDIDRAHHVARLKQGARLIAKIPWWHEDSPREAYFEPALRRIIVTTNRDSDVCEGLPSLEILRY